MKWLAKLQNVDRRWLYLATFVLMSLPFVVKVTMPRGKPMTSSDKFYKLIADCPKDKIILFDSGWIAGSAAENKEQCRAVINEMCRLGVKFVVVTEAGEILAPVFAQDIIVPIAKKYNRTYGVDYVNLGYTAGELRTLIGQTCRNLSAVYPQDYKGTPVDDLPLMRSIPKVDSYKKYHAIISITYSPDSSWCPFAGSDFKVPIAFGYMTIMHPSYVPLLDSGQLSGALVGNAGAADIENLLHSPGQGTVLHDAASFGNVMIILAAIMGNLGAWAGRRQSGRQIR